MDNQRNSFHNHVEGKLSKRPSMLKKSRIKHNDNNLVWRKHLYMNRINIEVQLKEKAGRSEFLDDLFFEIIITISQKTDV